MEVHQVVAIIGLVLALGIVASMWKMTIQPRLESIERRKQKLKDKGDT